MTTWGRTIRIYLAGGLPTGIRHAEIVNWTGQAVACPRARIGELVEWHEVARPGVYFLLRSGFDTDAGIVYIGESEDVLSRVADHVKAKDFWTELVAITSKDQNLTKAHIRHLERRLILLAKEAGRYTLDNDNEPASVTLPRSESDAMEEFLDNIRIVLGTLGHRFLEPFSTMSTSAALEDAENPLLGLRLSFPFKGLTACGMQTDEGFLVLRGSEAVKVSVDSAPDHVLALRDDAVAEGVLAEHDGHYLVTKDKLFGSPSTAAGFVSGWSKNGRDCWKDERGRSLKDIEDLVADSTQRGAVAVSA